MARSKIFLLHSSNSHADIQRYPTVKNTVKHKTKQKKKKPDGRGVANQTLLHANLAWRNAGSPYTTDCLFGPHSHSGIPLRFFSFSLTPLLFPLHQKDRHRDTSQRNSEGRLFPFFLLTERNTPHQKETKNTRLFLPLLNTHAHRHRIPTDGQTAQISRFVALLLRRLDFLFRSK